MIYVASPYSHIKGIDTNASPELTREQRYVLTMQAMAIWSKQGEFVYSPIVHCHEVAKLFGLPTNFEFWDTYNKDFIRASTEVWVLCLPNWQESRGVTAEVQFSASIQKKVRYWEFSSDFEILVEIFAIRGK